MTAVSVMRDAWDQLGLHLNQKYLKLGQKQLSYVQFPNGRLHDLSECHTRCKRFIKASLESKISKIGPEMARLWPNYQWEFG